LRSRAKDAEVEIKRAFKKYLLIEVLLRGMGIKKKTLVKVVWVAIVAMTVLSTIAFTASIGF
jgi:hypothetical protein